MSRTWRSYTLDTSPHQDFSLNFHEYLSLASHRAHSRGKEYRSILLTARLIKTTRESNISRSRCFRHIIMVAGLPIRPPALIVGRDSGKYCDETVKSGHILVECARTLIGDTNFILHYSNICACELPNLTVTLSPETLRRLGNLQSSPNSPNIPMHSTANAHSQSLRLFFPTYTVSLAMAISRPYTCSEGRP